VSVCPSSDTSQATIPAWARRGLLDRSADPRRTGNLIEHRPPA
jgi:hypothetical protein